MIHGKTVLAIIPARGGSKRIPRKNLQSIAGIPLIAWTILEAKKSKYLDRLILSSEDPEIITVAKKFDCEVPFVRPLYLAQDDTDGIEPIKHAISSLSKKYDFICLLQPTSPLRKVDDIDGCIEECIENHADSCVSVTNMDKQPNWMYSMNENKVLVPFIRNKELGDLRANSYVLNGSVYVVSCDQLLRDSKLITDTTIGYIMNKVSSIDIDDWVDLNFAKYIMENK